MLTSISRFRAGAGTFTRASDNLTWASDNLAWASDNLAWASDNLTWASDNLAWASDKPRSGVQNQPRVGVKTTARGASGTNLAWASDNLGSEGVRQTSRRRRTNQRGRQ